MHYSKWIVLIIFLFTIGCIAFNCFDATSFKNITTFFKAIPNLSLTNPDYIKINSNKIDNSKLDRIRKRKVSPDSANQTTVHKIYKDDRKADLTRLEIDYNKVTTISYGSDFFELEIYDDVAEYYSTLPRYWNYEYEINNYIFDEYNYSMIDNTVKIINNHLQEYGYSESAIVSYWVRFVQSIPYSCDTSTAKYDDWPQYPIETMYTQSGDCEDHAILLLCILQTMNYESALIILPEHAAVGLAANNLDGFCYEYNGIDYYYIESTSIWDIGDIPDEYKTKDAELIPINR